MLRIVVALRAFFAALFNRRVAEQIAGVLTQQPPAPTTPSAPPTPADQKDTPKPQQPPTKTRSDALTLLATLQREARFVDFLKESLEGASDEQIGAVVRDVHRDCAAVLERLFAVRPLLDRDEGEDCEVPAGFDAARFRLIGNVHGKAPYRGKLAHHGWLATRCDVPIWNGNRDAALVVAPADVEL